YWTDEQLQFLREQYPKLSKKELLIKVNTHFRLQLKMNQLEGCLKNHKITSGRTGRFTKGQPSWNKGKKGLKIGGKGSWFKKGHLPANYRPVGSERLNVDGYVEIKVADPNKWRLKQRHVWEQANGPILKGHVIIFLDQNKLNCELDNLMMITRAK